MRVRKALWIAVLLVASGGCGGKAYKKAVDNYASNLPKRGAIYYELVVVPELKKELVLADSGLICLTDKDHGKKDTPACACSDGLTDQWETNCKSWLDTVTRDQQ